MGSKDTKYSDLHANLAAVGKQVFVDFYYEIKDFSISEDDLAEIIHRNNPRSKSAQQRFRIPRARHIFQTGQEQEALRLVISSERVPQDTRMKAQVILQNEEQTGKMESEILEEGQFISEFNKELVLRNDTMFEYNNEPEPAKPKITSSVSKYGRNKTVAANALKIAQYKCEANESHPLFRRRNSELSYMEPHHIVPLSAAEDFPGVNLDREQNIVSLCSNCHNLLHYGADIEVVLRPLYEQRKELLQMIGIELSFEQLLQYYR